MRSPPSEAEHRRHRPEEDHRVEPGRPVVDVLEIEAGPHVELPVPPRPDLGEARDPRLCAESAQRRQVRAEAILLLLRRADEHDVRRRRRRRITRSRRDEAGEVDREARDAGADRSDAGGAGEAIERAGSSRSGPRSLVPGRGRAAARPRFQRLDGQHAVVQGAARAPGSPLPPLQPLHDSATSMRGAPPHSAPPAVPGSSSEPARQHGCQGLKVPGTIPSIRGVEAGPVAKALRRARSDRPLIGGAA